MIGKPGLPARTASGPGATIETKALGLLAALGNPEETIRLLEGLKTERLAHEAAIAEATAKVAEASKVIDDADNRDQESRETLRNVEQECARQRAVIAAAQTDLETDRAAHDEQVRADTEALIARDAAQTVREAAGRRDDEDAGATRAALLTRSAQLVDRETAVTAREAEMDAREERLRLALQPPAALG